MTDREIMQMALKALEVLTDNYDDNAVGIEIDAIIDLRKRLAQPEPLQRLTDVQQEIEAALAPEQEPVAWMYEWDNKKHLTFTDQSFVEKAHPHFNKSTPLYTAPQKREWQGLTDDEIDAIDKSIPDGTDLGMAKRAFARAIEAKLKEKND